MTWLLTGGAGYIGSHVTRALRATGRDVVILDDLSTGLAERVAGVPLVTGSLLDPPARLAAVIREHRITGLFHLAAKKSVPESVQRPLHYYEQNVTGTVHLLRAAVEAGVHRVLYSSSAAVYGETGDGLVDEEHPTAPSSPYGETKLAAEWLVRRTAEAHGMQWTALRYFNVAGAADALLADRGVFNLLPIVLRQHDVGSPVQVFGDDWPTPDGSCVRDYVHVDDLAEAHVAAVEAMEGARLDRAIFNVGRGAGVSPGDDRCGRARGRWPRVLSDIRPQAGRPAERRGQRIQDRRRARLAFEPWGRGDRRECVAGPGPIANSFEVADQRWFALRLSGETHMPPVATIRRTAMLGMTSPSFGAGGTCEQVDDSASARSSQSR